MNVDPISNHERSTILAQIESHGKWRARRGIALISLIRFPSPSGITILYSVQIGHRIVTARAGTVDTAIRLSNGVVREHLKHLERRR